ncbi:MAG: CocE/NonD family hydrolase [Elainella sp. C42_A2020_010]|nr:CocE/NonD family hydrolase [Elainella sp. C42_A2020_010]
MVYPVGSKQTLSMLTRDGVRLDADVYRPDSADSFPVLLMRQPYGRAIASTVVYAHPSWYAAQGYIVVIQDVRGRGSSTGEFELFAHEITDGEDAVNWAANLPQSNGQVGMYGFSYQGMTQLYAAATRPPALKTICPSMIGYDLYHDWAYEGGAFCYQLNLGWAIQLASETARRQANSDAYRTLYTAARNLPITDPVDLHSGILNQLAPNSHYHDWLAHPEPDAYWQTLSPCSYMENVDLPMLHIGGWYDTHLRGTLRFYRDIAARSRFPQHLIVGPWAHLPWGRKVGSVDYGPEANSPIDRLQLRWFDQFLKGIDTGLLDQPPVCLFEMGSNRWRQFDQFPSPAPIAYRLVTTGLAAMDEREGRLEPVRDGGDAAREPRRTRGDGDSTQCFAASDKTQNSNLGSADSPEAKTQNLKHCLPDTLVHDPWRPVPSLGGHAGFPAGSFERSAIDCRSDVLTYTTEPLAADLHLAGEITVELYCTADTPSFDLCAILSEVKPNGSVYNITQAYQRLPSPRSARLTSRISPTPHQLTLQPTCIRIPQGSAIRLSISAACFPAYGVNPGMGAAVHQGCLLDAGVITIAIFSESNGLSCVYLPIQQN